MSKKSRHRSKLVKKLWPRIGARKRLFSRWKRPVNRFCKIQVSLMLPSRNWDDSKPSKLIREKGGRAPLPEKNTKPKVYYVNWTT